MTADLHSTRSVLLAGVGGQGIVRASDILCAVFMAAGRDVKKSEVHGMAQRGGCVTSHVRYGTKVFSPTEKIGGIDILLAFEKLESLRYLEMLKPGARVIVNDLALNPPAVNLGDMPYPDDAVARIRERFREVTVVSAHGLARQAGNPKAENTALLGVLSRWLDIEPSIWEGVLAEAFSPKVVAANLKAFHLGRATE